MDFSKTAHLAIPLHDSACLHQHWERPSVKVVMTFPSCFLPFYTSTLYKTYSLLAFQQEDTSAKATFQIQRRDSLISIAITSIMLLVELLM